MENTENKTTICGNERPTVSKTNFIIQATENKLTRPQMAEYFGIKESQVSKLAKQLEVKIARNIQPAINLID